MGLGTALGAVVMATTVTRWLGIKNPPELQNAIRNDIRNFNPEAAEFLLGTLKSTARTYSIGSPAMREQATRVLETFVDEARRINLLRP